MQSMIVCLNCASFFRDKGGDSIICPKCEFSVDRTVYSRIWQYASDAARYGYRYRLRYEEDQTKGISSKRYQIPPDQVLSFIALAILSGIIGNLSYDAVKTVVRTIVRRFAKQRPITGSAKLELLRNEEQFNLFEKYITEFNEGMRQVDPVVASLIIQDMLIERATGVVVGLRKGEIISKDELKQELRKAFTTGAPTERPTTEDFEPLWRGLTNSKPDIWKNGRVRSKARNRQNAQSSKRGKRRQPGTHELIRHNS